MHELEVKGIADGDVAKSIKVYNPILAGQLSRNEVEMCSKDLKKIKFIKKIEEVGQRKKKPNILLCLKDKIDLMRFYGYVKMHLD